MKGGMKDFHSPAASNSYLPALYTSSILSTLYIPHSLIPAALPSCLPSSTCLMFSFPMSLVISFKCQAEYFRTERKMNTACAPRTRSVMERKQKSRAQWKWDWLIVRKRIPARLKMQNVWGGWVIRVMDRSNSSSRPSYKLYATNLVTISPESPEKSNIKNNSFTVFFLNSMNTTFKKHANLCL